MKQITTIAILLLMTTSSFGQVTSIRSDSRTAEMNRILHRAESNIARENSDRETELGNAKRRKDNSAKKEREDIEQEKRWAKVGRVPVRLGKKKQRIQDELEDERIALAVEKANEKYDRDVKWINEKYDSKIKYHRKEYEMWVDEEKKSIQRVEDRRIAKEKEKIEQEEASRLAKIETDKRNAEFKKIPSSPEYKKWVSKFEGLLSKSTTHMNRSEVIIKKYTYKNAFGRKMYDKSDFSKADHDTFIRNLESIKSINEEIDTIKEVSNKDYFWVWNDSVSMEKASLQNNLMRYYNSKRW